MPKTIQAPDTTKDDEPTPDALSIESLKQYEDQIEDFHRELTNKKPLVRADKKATDKAVNVTPNRLDRITNEKPAEPAEPVTPTPIVDDTPDGLSEKGKVDWQLLRDKHKAETDKLSAELKARNEELTHFKAHTPSLEMERLKKERDELSDQVRILNVVEHPKFKAYFQEKANGILKSAKAAVGEENATKIERLLAAPDSDDRSNAIDAIMDTLGPSRATRLANCVAKWSDMEDERTTEIGRARDNYNMLQEQQRTQQDQVRAKYKTAFELAMAKASDPAEGLAPFQTRADDHEWNQGVEKRRALANAIYSSNLPPEDLAKASLWAAAGPALAESAAAVLEQLSKVKAELASVKGATPSPGSGKIETKTDTKKYEGPDGVINSIIDQARAAGLKEY